MKRRRRVSGEREGRALIPDSNFLLNLNTWLVAFGASLSALWILVANAWMQNPVGMVFNPETARNEMVNFWQVLFNPVAVDKFLHTVTSGFLLGSIFVLSVSAWYLLRGRGQRA